MADENDKTPAEKPKKSRLLLIVVVLLLLVLAGGGFFAWKLLLKKDNSASKAAKAAKAVATASTPGIVMPLNAFIVNLMDRNGMGKRYLKVTMQVEVSTEKDVELVNSNKTQMRDAMLMLLSSITFEDINTMEGKLELKQALMQRLNQILNGKVISQLYFTEFVVQ